jgi:DNA-binding CsgD family transcriptional regulator
MVVRPPEITDEDLNNIPKINNGHTRKIINRSIMARRETIHSLMAKGYNQYQTAAILHCSQETVCKDVAWLRNYYKQQMHHYIENRLPELWESCLTQLHSTMAAVAKIAEDSNTPTHDKLHAHSLMVDCIKVKEGLISDPFIGIHILNMLIFFIHLPINEQAGQKIVVRRGNNDIINWFSCIEQKDH